MNSQCSKPTNSVLMLSSIDWDIVARLVEAFEDDMAESPDKLIPNLGDLEWKKSVVLHQRSRCFPVWLWELPVSFFFPNQGGPNYTMMLIAWWWAMRCVITWRSFSSFWCWLLSWCQGRNALKEHKRPWLPCIEQVLLQLSLKKRLCEATHSPDFLKSPGPSERPNPSEPEFVGFLIESRISFQGFFSLYHVTVLCL